MHACTLHPPHHHSLSDNVIGAVITQQIKKSSQVASGHTTYHHHRPHKIQRQHALNRHATEPTCSTKTANVFGTTDANNFTDDSHLIKLNSVVTTNDQSILAANQNGKIQFTSQEIVNMLVLDRIALRKRRQVIQQKYRKKLRDGEVALENSVIQRRQQIRRLEIKRERLRYTDGLANPTPSSVITRYFQYFRNGFRPTTSVSKLCNTDAMEIPSKAYVQTKFVQAAMAPGVVFNGGFGVEALLEEWRLISLHHEKLELQLVRMDHDDEGSVTAYINGVTEVTANMLRSARFDFLHNGQPDKLTPLTTKLLDQQLVITTTVRFDWDNSMGRITRVLYDADMLTPMLKLLSNLEEASSVLNSTLNVHHWSKIKSFN